MFKFHELVSSVSKKCYDHMLAEFWFDYIETWYLKYEGVQLTNIEWWDVGE